MPRMIASAREAAIEALELESKKLNLVVIGLPESNADGDTDILNHFCAKIHIDASDIVDSFRDGRSAGGRPRIVKVKFRNGQSRRAFLTGFHGVRGTIPSADKSWVRPDLTYQQRVRDRELRDELKRRRDAGEDNLKIRRGEIVHSN